MCVSTAPDVLLVKQGMSMRWVHVIVVLAITALFVNSQCYALCLASLHQTDSQAKANGCHKSSPSHNDEDPGCHHRRTDLTSTEASTGVAKVTAVSLPVVILPPASELLPTGSRFVPRDLILEQCGSPPGTPLFLSFSVLRI